VLRVPIHAEPRRLDAFLQFGARYGYDQPIIRIQDVIAAVSITSTEYYYSPPNAEPIPERIGTLTIEADGDGNYELRARVTDGQELSEPLGIVVLSSRPDVADCESKKADAVRELCGHESRPCERVALVGVNDIGPLTSVLAYVQAIADVPLPAVSFQQRLSEADNHQYFDAAFRRAHRVKRFFASTQPEEQMQKLPLEQSLARRRVGIYAPPPKDLLVQLGVVGELGRNLGNQQWVELGKSKACEQPGRTAASLVFDQSQKLRFYAERVTSGEKSELLVRAYYDESERLRLVIDSEISDTGEAWDAYLTLDENACPELERMVSRDAALAPGLHWELRQLKNPRAAYAEPLCLARVP
jgi:hypothetical protein